MREEIVPAVKLSIEEVRTLFESFREKRKGRRSFPEDLWSAAARLCIDHSVNRVSKALRLNYTDLSRRVKGIEPNHQAGPFPKFLEMDVKEVFCKECLVEFEKSDGSKLKIKGNIDPLELARLFWSLDR